MAIKQLETAKRLAAATPPSRNRYVDFLRAAAILAVVFGHWLMAAVWLDETGFQMRNLLGEIEATQWLTWLLQVMPLFFLVGGFSNATSWNRSSTNYGVWLGSRLRRLVLPTVPLIAFWVAIAVFGPQIGLDIELARRGSQAALVPLWFLGVYVVMVAATPITTALWDRFGARGVAFLAVAAVATDGLRAATTVHIGFANYLFVWVAISLLGHAWHSGSFDDYRRPAVLAALSGAALIAMTLGGPYHLSMVGVPGVAFGNTAPPTAALLALGLTQIGLALAVQRPMRRLLERPAAWTATVLINGSIMTLYVWHMTAMALTIGALRLVGSPLLNLAPDAGIAWWASRSVWIFILVLATAPFLLVLRRLEIGSRHGTRAGSSKSTALVAAAASCLVFGSVAAKGLTMRHPTWAAIAVVPLLPLSLWLGSSRATAPRVVAREETEHVNR